MVFLWVWFHVGVKPPTFFKIPHISKYCTLFLCFLLLFYFYPVFLIFEVLFFPTFSRDQTALTSLANTTVLYFSCFLLTMIDDSIEGIYDTLKQCALISKNAGGIGLNVHNIRATGSYIAGVSTLTRVGVKFVHDHQ